MTLDDPNNDFNLHHADEERVVNFILSSFVELGNVRIKCMESRGKVIF